MSEKRLELLFLLPLFMITWAKVRLGTPVADITYSYVLMIVFVGAFGVDRIMRRDVELPRAAVTVVGFMGVLLAVYLCGYFDLATRDSLKFWVKGLGVWVPHALFLICGITLIARRGRPLFERAVRWFVLGIAANAAYGIVQLGAQALLAVNLDRYVVGALTFGLGKTTGINVFGQVDGESNIYRINALAGDPNHLGVILCVPLLALLPVYLAKPRERRRLGLLLVFLFGVQVLTLSRSAALGDMVGLLVLLPWLRPILPRARVLAATGAGLAAAGAAAYLLSPFIRTVVDARLKLDGRGTDVHLEFYHLVSPALEPNPLFGMGFNTFAVFYEYVTGKTDFGPHSFWIATLVETGVAGMTVYLVWFGYLLLNAVAASHSENEDAARFGGGLLAALAGTAAANFFYLTMSFPYFFVLAMLVVTACTLFAPARAPERAGARAAAGTLGR